MPCSSRMCLFFCEGLGDSLNGDSSDGSCCRDFEMKSGLRCHRASWEGPPELKSWALQVYGTMIYGLVAPGYDMAEVVANNLVSGEAMEFKEADMSTKLKLLGVDVASFGDAEEKVRPDIPESRRLVAFGLSAPKSSVSLCKASWGALKPGWRVSRNREGRSHRRGLQEAGLLCRRFPPEGRRSGRRRFRLPGEIPGVQSIRRVVPAVRPVRRVFRCCSRSSWE